MSNVKIKQEHRYQFLSYQVLKYIGMVLLTISQLVTLTDFYSKFYGKNPILSQTWVSFLKNFSSMGLPLILIGVLTNILYNKDKIIRYIFLYLIGAIAFVFIFKYAVSLTIKYLLFQSNITLEKDGIKALTLLFISILGNFVNLNVFVDFFLCALFYFFLFYTPKKMNLKFFRALIIIPLLYMITSFVLIIMNKKGLLAFNYYLSSFMVSKRISGYAIFLGYLLMLKIKNKNYSSFYVDSSFVSMYLCVLIATISTIDYFLSFIPESTNYLVGDSYMLFLSIPIVAFFNYNMKIKHKWILYTMPFYYIGSYSILFYYYSNMIIILLSIFSEITNPLNII